MEEIVQCPACGSKVVPGKEFCTACGGAMSPTLRPAASSQTAPEVPKPVVDAASPAHVPPPAAKVNNADKSWVMRHKGLSIILAIAVVLVGIGIIQSNDSSDRVVAVLSCSPETLENLTTDWVDLGNSSMSAYAAIPDVLPPAAGSKRLKIRIARQTALQQKIQNECVNVSDSTAGTELLIAISDLQFSLSTLFTYYVAFLDNDTGTPKGINQRADTVDLAIDRFNAAWIAFGEEHGFNIDQTDDPVIDESKAAD